MACIENIEKTDKAVKILGQIYDLFDKSMAGFSVACAKQCADCCTCNVTATGLEIAYIRNFLDNSALDNLFARLDQSAQTSRFRPSCTTNGFALACIQGRDTDEEDNDPSWGACPLLEDGICTIYPVRPLGCRVMMSTIPCRQTGQADMPSLALTITTVFMQFVEHLDAGGVYGNFLDLLAYARKDGIDGERIQKNATDIGMAQNLKIPALMIPPGHVDDTRAIVESVGRMIEQK